MRRLAVMALLPRDPPHIRYTYDDRGLLTTRTTPDDTTRYAYDNQQRLVLQDGPDRHTSRYIYDENGLHAAIIDHDAYYYHHNTRGDVLRITDRRGRTIESYEYTPWGDTRTTRQGDGLGTTNPFTYNGRDGVLTDPDTGLMWMRARWYSPSQSRFISVDPVAGREGTTDTAYGYAGNDPVNQKDPDGTLVRARSNTFSGGVRASQYVEPDAGISTKFAPMQRVVYNLERVETHRWSAWFKVWFADPVGIKVNYVRANMKWTGNSSTLWDVDCSGSGDWKLTVTGWRRDYYYNWCYRWGGNAFADSRGSGHYYNDPMCEVLLALVTGGVVTPQPRTHIWYDSVNATAFADGRWEPDAPITRKSGGCKSFLTRKQDQGKTKLW